MTAAVCWSYSMILHKRWSKSGFLFWFWNVEIVFYESDLPGSYSSSQNYRMKATGFILTRHTSNVFCNILWEVEIWFVDKDCSFALHTCCNLLGLSVHRISETPPCVSTHPMGKAWGVWARTDALHRAMRMITAIHRLNPGLSLYSCHHNTGRTRDFRGCSNQQSSS